MGLPAAPFRDSWHPETVTPNDALKMGVEKGSGRKLRSEEVPFGLGLEGSHSAIARAVQVRR
jgi:hypothetical protein